MVAVTIRDVPDEVRDQLAARAASRGQSLQEYLRLLLVSVVEKPTVEEVLARARARSLRRVCGSSDSIVRAKDAERR